MKTILKQTVLGLFVILNLAACARFEKIEGADVLAPQLAELGCNPGEIKAIQDVTSKKTLLEQPPAYILNCADQTILCEAEPKTFNRDLIFHCQKKD